MTTYSDYEQRQLDIATSAAMDRRDEAAAIVAEAANLNVYHECMAVIRRHSDAYDYAMQRMDSETANRIVWEAQQAAGWYLLHGISVDDVWNDAVSPDGGRWKDFDGSYEIADQAAAYVAEQWDVADSEAVNWALSQFEQFAEDRGIELEEQDEPKF